MTKAAKLQLPLALALLATGGTIYLLLRPQTLLLFWVADGLGLSPHIALWRSSVSGASLPEWVLYCLPDALWTTAYILAIDTLLTSPTPRERLCLEAIIPAVGLCSELLQWAGAVPGTFDPLDLVAYALPYVAYFIIVQTKSNRYL